MTDKDREFAASIRSEFGDDAELRASLKSMGWVKELPAIKDEFGTILIGNRRLKIAAEENIEPVVKMIVFGDGDEADAKRLKLAIASNIGGEPFTPKDRVRISQHLYGERGWVMERIAQALDVSIGTVSGDLQGFSTAEKPPRPKGGRPKSSKPKKTRQAKPADVQEKHEKIVALADGGTPTEEIANAAGVGPRMVARVLEVEKARREGATVAATTVDPSTLSMSAQAKLDAAINQEKRRLAAEFERRVQAGIKEAIDETVLPQYLKEITEARQIIECRKGVMKLATYKLILRCLHPDNSASEDVRNRAFTAFEKLKLVLVKEEELTTPPLSIPRNYAEMMKARAAMKSRRRSRSNIQPRA